MEQPIKPKKVMTPEQLEILKARLMKARDAKIAKKGPVKEEPKQIPITNVVNEIVKEIPFEKPLPKKRVPKPKPEPQPDVIPFEKELPVPKSKPYGMGWKYPADPIDIPKKKEKDRFMKLVYYKEPSKKTLKKLEKLQESSSSSDESSEDEAPVVKQQANDEDAYYRALARKLYG